MTYDLIILGGGPAGCAAAVYAARKELKTLLITDSFGGQSIVSDGIKNWIGDINIPGIELAKKLEAHVRDYESDEMVIKSPEKVESVSKPEDIFVVKTNKDEYKGKTVLVTTGSHRRKLDVPGADEFEHKGITYCASCDGPFFKGKDLVVIGGGNAGFESASQLLEYANLVTLLHRSDSFKADKITVDKVLSHPKMTGVTNAILKEIKGDKFVTSLVYQKDGEDIEIETGGVFVEIGAVPTTEYLPDLVDKTDFGQVKVDPRTQETSCKGIWAAGDCTDGLYHQNNIAVGDAVKALEDIFLHLKTN